MLASRAAWSPASPVQCEWLMLLTSSTCHGWVDPPKSTASPERKSYGMPVSWIGSAKFHFVAAIIVMWSNWAGVSATELPGYSFEPTPLAAALCALHQLNHDYEPAVRACTEALRDGEDAEVYSNRGSALLMLNE